MRRHPVRLLRGGRGLGAGLPAHRLGKQEELVHGRRCAIRVEAQLIDEAAQRAAIQGLARTGAGDADDLDAELGAREAQHLAVAIEARPCRRFAGNFRLGRLESAKARGEGRRRSALGDLEAGLFRLMRQIEGEIGIGAGVGGSLPQVETREGALAELADRQAVDVHGLCVLARDGARQPREFGSGQIEFHRGLGCDGSRGFRRRTGSALARAPPERPKAEKHQDGGGAEPQRDPNAERSCLNRPLPRREEPVFFHSADAHHATPLARSRSNRRVQTRGNRAD